MKDNLSIDLETLDTVPSTKIVSIGAALFDIETGEVGETVYLPCSLHDQNSRTMSASTIMWWMSQSDQARAVFNDSDLDLLREQLKMFRASIGDWTQIKVWGNGATFDISILEDAYTRNAERSDIPWAFWNVRDMRTIVALAKQLNGFNHRSIVREGTHHNAVDDAVHQAKVISAAYQSLMP